MRDARIPIGGIDLNAITYTDPWVPLTKCAGLLMTTRGALYGKVYEYFICKRRQGEKDVLLFLPELIAHIRRTDNKLGADPDDVDLVAGLLRLQGAPDL